MRRHGLAAHGHHPLLVALADDGDKPGVKMKLFQADAAQFGQAQTRSVGQFQHRLVAQRGGRGRCFRFEQTFDFRIGKRLGQPLPAARQREIFGDVLRQDLFRLGKIVKGPQRGDLQVKAFRTELRREVFRLVLQGPGPLVSRKAMRSESLTCASNR